MKRRQVAKTLTCAAVLSVFALSGCRPAGPSEASESASAAEWQRPPSLSHARWSGNTISLTGEAEPNGRVVLAELTGRVYAVSAKGDGSFEIELNVPDQGLYLKPRSQVGQEFVDGHGLVFLKPGQHPVAVTLTDGEASYRLDHNAPLQAVDSDGAMMIVSGQAANEKAPRLQVGGQAMPIELDAEGRWAVVLPGGGAATSIQLDDKTYSYPGLGRAELDAEFISGGWRIARKIGDKAVQSTWLPVDR